MICDVLYNVLGKPRYRIGKITLSPLTTNLLTQLIFYVDRFAVVEVKEAENC